MKREQRIRDGSIALRSINRDYEKAWEILDGKVDQTLATLERIELQLIEMDQRLRTVEITSAKMEVHADQIRDLAEAAHLRLDERGSSVEEDALQEKVTIISQRLSEIDMPLKVITWVGATFGLAVIGLIWALITHQVDLVYP